MPLVVLHGMADGSWSHCHDDRVALPCLAQPYGSSGEWGDSLPVSVSKDTWLGKGGCRVNPNYEAHHSAFLFAKECQFQLPFVVVFTGLALTLGHWSAAQISERCSIDV